MKYKAGNWNAVVDSKIIPGIDKLSMIEYQKCEHAK
jgi:hypothetical protein